MWTSLLAFSLMVGQAEAAKSGKGPKMWGVGPSVSSVLSPFPIKYPTTDASSGVDSPADTMVKNGFDLGIGARGVLYLNPRTRLGTHLHGNFGFGDAKMFMPYATIDIERKLLGKKKLLVYGGGGVGIGSARFNQDGGDLKVGLFPIRPAITLHYSDRHGKPQGPDDRAYELTIWGQLALRGKETFTDADGNETSDPAFSLQQNLKLGVYNPAIGLEATVFFGDFSQSNQARNKKKGKGKKKR